MNESKSNGILLCLGATLSFWLTVLLGPAIIRLLNNLGYYFSGSGWRPDSLMYSVLVFVSQPLSCGGAYLIGKAVSKEEHPVCVLVNTIVCTCMCTIFALVASSTSQMVIMIISAVICIIMAVLETKRICKMIHKAEHSVVEDI